jgi:methyltransferase
VTADLPLPPFLTSALALIFASMLLEARVSTRNERALRRRGATEPGGDVWRVMSAVYPAAFLAMALESVVRGGPPREAYLAGLFIWLGAKVLKLWAITSLGQRWSFKVLVLPNAPLVSHGPYRWMRHPNYAAVAGELVGAAVMMAAPMAGAVCTLLFIEVMRRRIRVEERALGIGRSPVNRA